MARRNNSRKPRNSSKFDAGKVPGGKKPGRNDISWWAKNPELLASAARVPFTKRPGTHLDESSYSIPIGYGHGDDVQTTLRYAIPGVMGIKFDYSIGYSKDVTSAASITAKELYAQVRRSFSGSLDEDAPDLFMYVMALDQIHAYIAWLKRLYRTINAYSSENYHFPEMVFKAMIPNVHFGGVYAELRRNKVELWNFINTLVNMVNKFNCPKNMDIFERHRWMNEHIYSDIDAVRGQMYLFTPNGFFWVTDTKYSTGTALEYHPGPNVIDGSFLDGIMSYGYGMISALSNWEDAYTINGHIERAFEGTEFYGAAVLMQDEQIAPVYNEEVLLQIHNLTAVNDFHQEDIKQDPLSNAIIYTPFWEQSNKSVYIDLPGAVPPAESVVVATRLCSVYNGQEPTCGTEVVTGLAVSVPNYLGNPTTSDPYGFHLLELSTSMYIDLPVTQSQVESLGQLTTLMHSLRYQMQLLDYINAWGSRPRFYVAMAMGNNDPRFTPTDEELNAMLASKTVWSSGGVDNMTNVDSDDIADLHRICLYSIFNCFNK